MALSDKVIFPSAMAKPSAVTPNDLVVDFRSKSFLGSPHYIKLLDGQDSTTMNGRVAKDQATRIQRIIPQSIRSPNGSKEPSEDDH